VTLLMGPQLSLLLLLKVPALLLLLPPLVR